MKKKCGVSCTININCNQQENCCMDYCCKKEKYCSNTNIMESLDIATRDNKHLNVLAMKNKLENVSNLEETHRTIYRRERDRILYSGGFRRMQDKTQVMSAVKNGDHRTRLTHTLEVEQIAVSIADALNLNKDLTSAIALGHDIGHTPFGHAVERYLDDELKLYGGFSHAVQSVRYIEQSIEKKSSKLSKEILEGILKHDTDSYTEKFDGFGLQNKYDYFVNKPPGTLEAQIVYWADKIAYITHDFDDFRKNKLIFDEALEKSESSEKFISNLERILNDLIEERKGTITLSNFANRDLVRNLITNLIKNSHRKIIELENDIIKGNIDLNNISEDEKQNIIREYTQKSIDLTLKKNNINISDLEKIIKIIDKFLKKYNVEKFYDSQIKEIYLNNIYEDLKEFIIELKNIMEKYEIENKIMEFIENIERILNGINKDVKSGNICNYIYAKKINELLNGLLYIKEILNSKANKINKKAYTNGLIINLDDDYRGKYSELKEIIDEYYIQSKEIQWSDNKAQRIIKSLFNMYVENSKLLPLEFQSYGAVTNKAKDMRSIADYISTMSDRYAEELFSDLDSTGSSYNY